MTCDPAPRESTPTQTDSRPSKPPAPRLRTLFRLCFVISPFMFAHVLQFGGGGFTVPSSLYGRAAGVSGRNAVCVYYSKPQKSALPPRQAALQRLAKGNK